MNPETDKIFISIASYRDPQLGLTIFDLMEKAAHPERLRFGICWQKDEHEPELPYDAGDPRFRVLDVDYRDSRGACWARAETMKLWQGEEWFLQLDSHCRFLYGWDERLIRAAGQTGVEKPLLSTYAAPFRPNRYDILAGPPLQMVFQAFTGDGLLQLNSALFPAGTDLSRPVPARFLAAGFLFAPGRFVEDVPYDPDIYFVGEECSMTLRAWTSGYDLFHPAENVVWHDYGRHDAIRHWTDHTPETAKVEPRTKPWGELDLRSRQKLYRLLRGEPVESCGLGDVRTLQQYEEYAGISLAQRKVQRYTMRGLIPPNPPIEPGWEDRVLPWITRIRVPRSRLPEDALTDATIWCIALQDAEGEELARLDAMPEHLAEFGDGEDDIVFTCEFPSEAVPAKWVIKPQGRVRGWLAEVYGELGADDVAIVAEDEEEGAAAGL